MTLTGTKVEGYERMDKNLEKIVIGQIEKIEKASRCRQTDYLPG